MATPTEFLTADHDEVMKLFDDFHQMQADPGREDEQWAIVERLCLELSIHAQIEEELFYPAVSELLLDETMVDEAVDEHAEIKVMIADVQALSGNRMTVDEKIFDLMKAVRRHVEEEQGAMFPRARELGLDNEELGKALAQRREELKNDPAMLDLPPKDAYTYGANPNARR